jgi:archaemetzincin
LALLRELGAGLDALLPATHHIGRRLVAARIAGDPNESGALLDALIARADAEHVDPRETWLLAVSGRELRAPGHGRVFGEAAVGAGCAVVGLAPLDTGSRCDASTLLQRALKVCVHEAGHAAGLEHCADRACVMYPSRDIADVDRKDKHFCRSCARDLDHATLDAART